MCTAAAGSVVRHAANESDAGQGAALLTAELTDNAGWELLIQLADEQGHSRMAHAFRKALEAEERRLSAIKGWLRQSLMAEAT